MSDPTPMAVPSALDDLERAFPGMVAALRDARLAGESQSPLSEREIELIRIGVMIALDAPQASFDAHVERARALGASREEIVAVAGAVATIVGIPKLLATLPRLAQALDT